MLFRKKIDKFCTYCIHSAKIDENTCLCVKKGIVRSAHHCRKFKYDPLKRVPPRMNPKDFESCDNLDFSL